VQTDLPSKNPFIRDSKQGGSFVIASLKWLDLLLKADARAEVWRKKDAPIFIGAFCF
jgi:hypothetical protein